MEPEFPELAWLYPEVVRAGSLAAALRRAAAEIGGDVGDVTANESNPLSYAGVASVVPAREALGVSVGHVERYFSVGGWGQGVELLTGSTGDLAEVARLAQAWRTGRPLVEIRRLVPFVRVSERALAHERGPEHVVAYQWRQLFADVEERADWPEFGELVRAAYGEPRLRQLYVYTSHWSIQFLAVPGTPSLMVGCRICIRRMAGCPTGSSRRVVSWSERRRRRRRRSRWPCGVCPTRPARRSPGPRWKRRRIPGGRRPPAGVVETPAAMCPGFSSKESRSPIGLPCSTGSVAGGGRGGTPRVA